jgi:Txe/YoeB family toxin of Txe-Axe toxin-antitoxin module
MPFVPKKPWEFEAERQYILDTVSKLRAQIQELQGSIDVMVFRLYGVPEGLSRSRSIPYSRRPEVET